MTSPGQRPERTYLNKTLLVLGNGFQFSSAPPPNIREDRYFRSTDHWEVLGSALARLQAGDFAAVEALPRILNESDGAVIWAAATQLLGYAGPWSVLKPFAQRLIVRRDEAAVQIYAPEMLEGSMAPWAVELLLELHEVAFPTPTDRASLIQGCLSRLLEPQAGPIDEGPEEVREAHPDYPEVFAEYRVTYRTDRFQEEVRARKAALIERLGTDRLAVAESDVFSVEKTALRLLDRLRNEPDRSGRLDFERMRLEAATGLDCRDFYSRNGQLQRLPAMAVIEDFLESGRSADFEPGRRYFFGHPIPD